MNKMYLPEIIMAVLATVQNVTLIVCITALVNVLHQRAPTVWSLLPLLALYLVGFTQFTRD